MIMSYLLTHFCVLYFLELKFDTLYHFYFYLVVILFFNIRISFIFHKFCLFCLKGIHISFSISFSLCHIFGLYYISYLFHSSLLSFFTFKRLHKFFYQNYPKFIFMSILIFDVSWHQPLEVPDRCIYR